MLLPPPPAGGGGSTEDSASAPEEIVVTARQRKEKAQEVPIPLTVLNGSSLAATSTVRIEEIQQRLPDMNVAYLNPRQNSIAVRGLGNNPANDGLEASVGVYLDGIYLGRPGMAILDFNDIEQLEYLRGPQGTLFGKNTTAGALNITTKAPSFTLGGDAEFTVGNLGNQQYAGTVTGPLIENVLAARLSVYDHTREGFVQSIATGEWDNDIGRQGARLSLLYDANDDLSFRLIGDYNREHDGVAATFYSAAPNNTLFPFFTALAAHEAGLGAAGLPVIPTPKNMYQTNINDPQTVSVQQGGATLQGNWDLGDYKLTSITGYRFWRFSPHNDADGTNLTLLPDAHVQNHDQQFSQELRVDSPKDEGPIDYTAGLYYFWQAQRTNQDFIYGNNEATAFAYGPQFVNKSQIVLGRLRTRSYAAFAQGNYHIQDDLTLTVGVRNTLEQKTMGLYRDLGGTVLNPAVPNIDSTGVSPKSNNVSWTAQLAYQIEPDINLFASYAHGAKAGATNNSPPQSVPLSHAPLVVYPEKADDVELGIKSELFDRQLVLNANAFYTLVRNYQATSFFFDPSNPALAGSILTNVGAVRTRGVEVEATARPFEGLTLNSNLSYDNASYQSFRAGPCAAEYGLPGSATCDLTGRPVVGAPRWTFDINGTYEFPLTDSVQAYVNAELSWRSSFYSVIDDSLYSKIGNYGVVNMRVGARFYDGKVDVSFWTKNLGDRSYFQTLSISSSRGTYSGYPGDPLTFGGTIRVSY
ncbi:MAG TPA: TonB-dependent receptor [Alphaproteobacteria bacterium]|nr:TonB-dependent receptor [Alphaproteobacteria bacterium]